MRIDIVCQVVDNYGDIAVVWRLAQALVQDGPGVEVRLLVDDWETFGQLNPQLAPEAFRQELEVPGGRVLALRAPHLDKLDRDRLKAADVLVEAFGAPAPVMWLEAFFTAPPSKVLKKRIILHLEYLAAEAWTEEYHLLPSPIGRPGVERHFFVPGFRPKTGGLVFTDPPRPEAAAATQVAAALRGSEDLLITLFSYEHDFTAFWRDLAEHLAATGKTARVLVFAGRSRAGALASWEGWRQGAGEGAGSLVVVDQPFVDQDTYTALLAAGDFHVVRGEESWVQALLAGKPFLWHAYLQAENHQLVKVEAFLEVARPWFEAEGDEGLRVFEALAGEFRAFNDRLVNSEAEAPRERYGVFFAEKDLLGRVWGAWGGHLRKNAKLSRKMLEFLEKFRI